ncbi:hypothetical protein PsorP6_011961 [Peronosclerospora sorghi]|uniref:Uncharacterized protein n=1 Tax=Peronosclerospora sorghi TaxID=230839 RepID=A0ACC0WL59_9STRA|nr:hypothetical protein PsorP6_011961 [Peronosclerospora sorghi]
MAHHHKHKWVNVDYTNRLLDESVALPPASPRSAHGDTLLPSSSSSGPDHDAVRAMATSTSYVQEPSPPSTIQVTVREPVKQGEGMNAYISYKICTVTSRPQFAKTSFSVVRRYRDFIWLHASLSALYPGVVVPPLPEKLLVGRFSPEFIESRRRALQVFLHRCCLHPELQHSEHVTTFLEARDDHLQAFRTNPRHAALHSQRGALFQWLDDTMSTLSSTWIPSTTTLPKTPADLEVDDVMAYIEGLEPIMTGLHKHAHGLTKRAREIADGLFEFGVSLTLLGKSEANPSLQEGLRHIGQCSDQLSMLAAEHAEREALHFEEPIFDYIRLVGAVKAALHKRHEVRCAYGAAVEELEAKEAVLGKLVKTSRGAAVDDKVQLAETDVRRAQQHVEDTKLEHDIVTERVLREVERFKREKLVDFKHIILDYIQMQIEYSKKVEDEWQQVLPKLAKIHVDTRAAATPAHEEAKAATNALGPVIQEDYIPSHGDDVSERLSDLTLMGHAATAEEDDPFQRSPYDSHPLEDSTSDLSL